MYSPAAFSVSDTKIIREFIADHSFGIIVSHDGKEYQDTHTPLFLSDDMQTLYGHIAKANPQWKSWVSDPGVKVIFHGPHAYVSPRFYASEFNVPTWNYSAVSISGNVRILDDPAQCTTFIHALVEKYEDKDGWRLDEADERYMKLLDAIVCFEISITKLEAKFKMNQNKTPEDRTSVISQLLQSSSPTDQETGSLMQKIDKN